MDWMETMAIPDLNIATKLESNSDSSGLRRIPSNSGLFNQQINDFDNFPDLKLEFSKLPLTGSDWSEAKTLNTPQLIDLLQPSFTKQNSPLQTDQLFPPDLSTPFDFQQFGTDSFKCETAFDLPSQLDTYEDNINACGASLPNEDQSSDFLDQPLTGFLSSFCASLTDDELPLEELDENQPDSLLQLLQEPVAVPALPSPTPSSSGSDCWNPDDFLSSQLPTLDLGSILNDLDILSAKPSVCSFVEHDHCYASQPPQERKKDMIKKVSQLKTSTSQEKPKISAEDKYKERRRRNNIASQRSRFTRKQKFVQQEVEAEELEKENEELKARIAQMEKAASALKQALFQKLVKIPQGNSTVRGGSQ